MSEKRTQELKRTIEQIKSYSGRGTELVSVYVPPGRLISDVTTHLSQEYSEAENIKKKRTRKNVQAALSSIRSRLRYYDSVPDNGLVAFSGVVNDNEEKTIVIDSLPYEVESYRYYCDDEFLVEPLVEMVEDDSLYALIVIDQKRAHIGKLSGSRIDAIDSLSSSVPGKHKKGGQSQARFRRRREKSLHEFYKSVGERVNAEFTEERHNIEGVLVGGPSPTKEEFLESSGIHHEILEKVISRVDLGDTTERGLSQLVEKSQSAIQESEHVEERKTVDSFFKAIRDDTATYGVQECYTALQRGAVETLLISGDRIDDTITISECEQQHTVAVDESTAECHLCGSNVESEDDVSPLTDALTELAENRGTTVVFVSSDFDEGSQFSRAFTGVGAILRYNPFDN